MSERLRAHQTSGDVSSISAPVSSRLAGRSFRTTASGGRLPDSISLDTVLARIHALPTFSPVVIRALQLADRETISAREIVGVVNADVRFGARVVKAANAPAYGLPRTVTTVNDAVLLLGTDAIREVVLIAAARDIFYRPLSGYGVSAHELWAHSLACAMASEIVADMTGYSNRTEAFISGLLHDVGKIVLNEDMQSAAPFVREEMIREGCTFIDAERTVLGYDHCDIGGRVIRSWGAAQHLVQAVALHRKPVVSRQTVPLAGFAHMGEILCSMAGVGIGFEGLDMVLETQVLTDFKLTEEKVDIALGRLVDKLAASANLLTPPSTTAPS